MTLSGWGMRERVVLGRWSRPQGYDRPLRRRHGAPPDVTEVFGAQDARELTALRERFLAAPGRVADAALELLRDRRFDLVWLTFAAPHLAGHRLWEAAPEGEDAALPPALAGTLADIYERTDEQLGRVLRALPDDCDVIACSVLGMDVNTSRADMLPGMLGAVLGEGAGSAPLPVAMATTAERDSGAIWRLRGAVPRRARSARRARSRRGSRSSSRPGSSCAASTGRRPPRSPTRPTTRATSGSTSAAGRHAGSSTRAPRTR